MNKEKNRLELTEFDHLYIGGVISYDEYLKDIDMNDFLLKHGIYMDDDMIKNTRCENKDFCLDYCNDCKVGTCCDGYVCSENNW